MKPVNTYEHWATRLTHTLETQAILRWTRCPGQIIYTRNSSFTWTLLELQSSDNKKAAT